MGYPNEIICGKEFFRYTIFIANNFVEYCYNLPEAKQKARKLAEDNPECIIQIRENIFTYHNTKGLEEYD